MFDFSFVVEAYFWLTLSGAVAVAAGNRGRAKGEWFVFSVLTSPIVAAAYLFAMPPRSQEQSVTS